MHDCVGGGGRGGLAAVCNLASGHYTSFPFVDAAVLRLLWRGAMSADGTRMRPANVPTAECMNG
eukprot:scaffold15698_cov154-Skeletonema_marinoi.AAC.2